MHQIFEDKPGRLFIFTGAGISAPSGLDTFRSSGGIWERYDVNQVCNITHFNAVYKNAQELEPIYAFYQAMHKAVSQAAPNGAHIFCAKLQQQMGVDRVKIITTNVDDLHQRAGALDVLHLHGNLQNMHCLACTHSWAGSLQPQPCPRCQSKKVKPHVIFFGEMAPAYEQMASLLHPKRMQANDMLLVIGSSLQVVGVEQLLRYDRYHPRRTENILVNAHPTPFDHLFKYHYLGDVVELLPTLERHVQDHFRSQMF